jgi:hypothetical protein
MNQHTKRWRESMATKSGILCLDVEGWTLSVRTLAGGFEVSVSDDAKPAASHYVRLDPEQSETLRDFLNEIMPDSNGVRK